MTKFADRLRELRTYCGTSQATLADVLGVTPQTISNYEVGKREPSISELIIISEYFHVSVDYLVGNTDDITAPKREIFYSIIDSIFIEATLSDKIIDGKISKIANGKSYKWSDNAEDLK